MFGVIMPLCNRMFCCIFGWYFYVEIRLEYEKNILLSSSRTFSLSTPTFPLSTPVDISEAPWKIATKCNKRKLLKDKICFSIKKWDNFQTKIHLNSKLSQTLPNLHWQNSPHVTLTCLLGWPRKWRFTKVS